MACNAWNHSSRCNCGWGGVSYGLPTPQGTVSEQRISFANPNARCPACGESVFFFRSENGGAVYFDSLGWPWPKHPCMDQARSRGGRAKTAIVASPPVTPRSESSDSWVAFEIWTVECEEGRTIVVGRPDGQPSAIRLGIPSAVIAHAGLPAFVRPKPERIGIVDFTTLSDLEPIEVDAYLDCSELADVQTWVAALRGSHSDQNMVGWLQSFGRARSFVSSPSQFSRANWRGGMHWMCLAAEGGYSSALNNLASEKMMAGCGIPASDRVALREQLYAAAKRLDDCRASPSLELRDALDETRRLASLYRTLHVGDG